MNANDQPSDGKQSEKQREEVEEEDEVETPDYQDKLLARIRQMRSEGESLCPVRTCQTQPIRNHMGNTTRCCSTTSRFGR